MHRTDSSLLLLGNRAFEPRWSVRWILAGASFGLGLLLAGGLLPLSVLFRLMPFGSLDAWAGNAPGALIPYEKYIWYQIPLAGIYLTALALSLALMAARDTPSRRGRLSDYEKRFVRYSSRSGGVTAGGGTAPLTVCTK